MKEWDVGDTAVLGMEVLHSGVSPQSGPDIIIISTRSVRLTGGHGRSWIAVEDMVYSPSTRVWTYKLLAAGRQVHLIWSPLARRGLEISIYILHSPNSVPIRSRLLRPVFVLDFFHVRMILRTSP